MKHFLALLILFSLMLISFGCAFNPPLPDYTAGVQLDTLSAEVSLSIMTAEQGMSASGYLLYQRPDKMRLVIMSPFGTTLMEAVVSGENITVVNNAQSVLFTGLFNELPQTGEGATWRNARWIMNTEPPGTSIMDGTIERINIIGLKEQLIFKKGLILSKRIENGDQADYNGYLLVNDVPVATEIIMHSANGDRFRMKITEPEVNQPLSEEAFKVNLPEFKRYPLSLLQEKK